MDDCKAEHKKDRNERKKKIDKEIYEVEKKAVYKKEVDKNKAGNKKNGIAADRAASRSHNSPNTRVTPPPDQNSDEDQYEWEWSDVYEHPLSKFGRRRDFLRKRGWWAEHVKHLDRLSRERAESRRQWHDKLQKEYEVRHPPGPYFVTTGLADRLLDRIDWKRQFLSDTFLNPKIGSGSSGSCMRLFDLRTAMGFVPKMERPIVVGDVRRRRVAIGYIWFGGMVVSWRTRVKILECFDVGAASNSVKYNYDLKIS